jgi:hypothetical protein
MATAFSISTGEKVSEKTSVAFAQIAQSISEISYKMGEIDAAIAAHREAVATDPNGSCGDSGTSKISLSAAG